MASIGALLGPGGVSSPFLILTALSLMAVILGSIAAAAALRAQLQ
jgi:hypothetical protein